LENVRTRVVAPLVLVADLGKPIADLNPIVLIDDARLRSSRNPWRP